jgi:hypothetical protein
VKPNEDSIHPDELGGTLKFNADGLEIKSQVIGLLVLALSLAFFYLYILYVYPMQTEELTRLQQKKTAESGDASGRDTPTSGSQKSSTANSK